jgi:hypothetical protein
MAERRRIPIYPEMLLSKIKSDYYAKGLIESGWFDAQRAEGRPKGLLEQDL